MKKVVSFSFGRTSARLSVWAKERFPGCAIVSMDTTAEHEKTYDFGRKCNDYFDLNITVLQTVFTKEMRVGNEYKIIDPSEMKCSLEVYTKMIEKYGVPYIGGMFCNDRMKMVPFKKYCNEKYGRGNYKTILGIRIDEPSRILGKDLYRELKKLGYEDYQELIEIYTTLKYDGVRGLHGWLYIPFGKKETAKAYKAASKRLKNLDENIYYMAEFLDDEKQDVNDWWEEQEFDLEIPDHLGNCVFCPKKSNLKLAAAQRDEPELYHEFLTMLYGAKVRHDDNTGHWSKMYRGKKSLEQVVAMFDGSTGDEIKARIRGTKATNTGSCSESCEVFVCEDNQMDMFQ